MAEKVIIPKFSESSFGKYVKAVESLLEGLGEYMISPGDQIKFLRKELNGDYTCLLQKKEKEIEFEFHFNTDILYLGLGDANVCNTDFLSNNYGMDIKSVDFTGAIMNVRNHKHTIESTMNSPYDFDLPFDKDLGTKKHVHLQIDANVYSFYWETYPNNMTPENYLYMYNRVKDEKELFQRLINWWENSKGLMTYETLNRIKSKIEECCKNHNSFESQIYLRDYYYTLERYKFSFSKIHTEVLDLETFYKNNKSRIESEFFQGGNDFQKDLTLYDNIKININNVINDVVAKKRKQKGH